MPKSHLEYTIEKAAAEFAAQIIEAVKGATLEELLALSQNTRKKTIAGMEPFSSNATKQKRIVKNYPKCAYPGCEKNRFVRGSGFCGEHWKKLEAGEIQSASFYKNKNSDNETETTEQPE